jgi:hypothetical protein
MRAKVQNIWNQQLEHDHTWGTWELAAWIRPALEHTLAWRARAAWCSRWCRVSEWCTIQCSPRTSTWHDAFVGQGLIPGNPLKWRGDEREEELKRLMTAPAWCLSTCAEWEKEEGIRTSLTGEGQTAAAGREHGSDRCCLNGVGQRVAGILMCGGTVESCRFYSVRAQRGTALNTQPKESSSQGKRDWEAGSMRRGKDRLVGRVFVGKQFVRMEDTTWPGSAGR